MCSVTSDPELPAPSSELLTNDRSLWGGPGPGNRIPGGAGGPAHRQAYGCTAASARVWVSEKRGTIMISIRLLRWSVPTLLLAGLLATLGCRGAEAPARPEQLLREAARLEVKARELKEAGRMDASEQAGREAKELRVRARGLQEREGPTRAVAEERESLKRESMELRAQLERARSEGRDEEAREMENHLRKLERELAWREAGARPRRERQGPERESPEAGERIRHLKEAIAHLHAAGMHEPAERLTQQLDHLRQPRIEEGPGPGLEQLRAEMEELRQAVRELRARIEEMSRR